MSSDKKIDFKGLCISAGGLNGLYYLGALDYYYENKQLDNVLYYSGTSIGSLICLLLIIGYTPKEIFIYVCQDDLLSYFIMPSVNDLIQNYGLFEIDILRKYVNQMLLNKLAFIPTFKELYEEYEKTFYCTSYNISQDEGKTYFSHHTHPNMLVSDAVVCSCSIPFIFSKTKLNDQIFIDGAIFDSTPLSCLLPYFSSTDYESILTIGYLLKKHEIRNEENNNIFKYANRILSLLTNNMNDICYKTHLIQVESTILPFMLSMTTSTKVKLFIDGRNTVIRKYKLKEKLD